MTQNWLRLYRAAVHNPKVQRLGLEAVGFWANCLCLSDDDGRIPQVQELAWSMRVSETVAETFLKRLHETGLLDRDGFEYALHDWHEHQFKSDSSTERVRRFRQKNRKKAKRNVSETAQNRAETDTEQKAESARARAIRSPWPESKPVPEPWLRTAEGELRRLGFPAIDLPALAAKFQNHNAANPQPRTLTEWQACFQNWAINEAKADAKRERSAANGQPRSLAASIFGE